MGYARSLLIDTTQPGTYHCVSRCVRRAYLCGRDAVSGRNFDHRKQWIEDRLLMLAEIFAASVLSYAVMSNHVHVVLRMEPDDTLQWSDEAVAKRWTNLFPSKVNGVTDIASDQQRIASILGNPERLAILRNRLGNLSWFMRCLSEPIARRANHEDECTGRFWEGRFKCQVLLDDRAVLACMAYVDLNPVRAKTAEHLIGSTHTSIRRRILTQTHYEAPLCAVAGKDSAHLFSLTQRDYIALVEWTGSQLHPNGRGHICRSPPQLVQSWNDNTRWLAQVGGIESLYFRAIGSANALIELALALGQRWMKGARSLSDKVCTRSALTT